MKVARVSRELRLVFVGLWNEADDEGRLLASPKRLAGSLFPNDDDVDPRVMGEWLATLERARLIVRYEAAGVAYAWIPGFNEHQKIDKRWPSRLPAPPESLSQHSESLSESSEGLAKHSAPDMSSSGNDLSSEDGYEAPVLSHQGSRAALAIQVEPDKQPTSRARINREIPVLPHGRVIGAKPKWTAGKPYTVEELMRQPEGQDLKRKFPALDGNNGRPTIESIIGSMWENYAGWSWPTQAMDKLESYVARNHERYRVGWAKEGGVMPEKPRARAPPHVPVDTDFEAELAKLERVNR